MEKDGITFRYNQTFGHWEYRVVGRDLRVLTDWTYVKRSEIVGTLCDYMAAREKEK